MREHADILLVEISHAKGNGALIYIISGRRQTKLPISNSLSLLPSRAVEGSGGQKLQDSLVFIRRAIHETI